MDHGPREKCNASRVTGDEPLFLLTDFDETDQSRKCLLCGLVRIGMSLV